MKKTLIILLILISAGLASRWLFKSGYFLMHDDMQMMRQLQLEKCLKDQQIPCRWSSDLGFGYGYPLFNFYPSGPYIFGQIFRVLGFSFINTVKLTFALQFFLSGITMYILARELWGKWGGLVSSVFYIWAPYHSLDVYIRGAMNEAWGFVWFPLILWAIKKLIESEKLKYLIWLALSFSMLLLTHNLMVIIFIPAALIWGIYWLYKYKNWPWESYQLWLKIFAAGLWALGLAAFFTLPVLFEKRFTHIEKMFQGYYDWRAHFTTLHQLFISRFWGLGPSVWGTEDGMAFPVGHVHWITALILVAMSVFKWSKQQFKLKSKWLLLILLFGLGLSYIYLTHGQSAFIWEAIPILDYVQFPWRLLAGSTLFLSLLAGASNLLIKNKKLLLLLVVLVIGWNWQFFQPEKMGPLTEEQKFSGKAWEYQQTSGIYDYLPQWVPQAPKSAPEKDWIFRNGKVISSTHEKGTDWIRWQGEVNEQGQLVINTFYFPGWQVWVDEEETDFEIGKDLGRIVVPLTSGQHEVYAKFTETPIRKWANLISLLSWTGLIIVVTQRKWSWLPIK